MSSIFFVAFISRYSTPTILLCALLLTLNAPVVALAKCGHGHSVAYSDVNSIYVERRGVAGPNYSVLVSRRGEVEFVGHSNVPVIGTYDGYDGSTLFVSLLAILQTHDFYDMQLKSEPNSTPGPKGIIGTIVVDGPNDHVAVLRCGVLTKIETYGTKESIFLANNPDDPQTRLLVELVDALQMPVFAWRWESEKRVIRPSPTASRTPQRPGRPE